MRTTVDLPDDLFVAVKKRALELHQPLRVLIESVLRKELGQPLMGNQTTKPKLIRWVSSSADVPDFDLSSREAMMDWLKGQS